MSETPKADFWFSIFLTTLGTAIAIESWRMPRLENLGVHPMSAPGLTPGLLGIVLAVLGVLLLARSLRAVRVTRAVVDEDRGPQGWRRLWLTLLLCFLYAIVLLGRLPFWSATALFVLIFVLAFTWHRRSIQRCVMAAALAIAVAIAVTLLFEQVFLVRLP